jgi:casein kinase II subunit beta
MEFIDSRRFADSVPQFDAAKLLFLEPDSPMDPSLDAKELQSQSEILYGLIHAAFLSTPEGCHQIMQKLEGKVYGHCPRLFCQKTPCIPCGSADIKSDMLKRYCPTCRQIYRIENQLFRAISGVYFGMDYIEMFVGMHPEVVRVEGQTEYVPRIYGFKLAQSLGTTEVEEQSPD